MALCKLSMTDLAAERNVERNVEKNPVVEDEPLFMVDISDIDMDEILVSQKESANSDNAEESFARAAVQTTQTNRRSEADDFEDEMDAIRELNDF